MGTTRRRRRMGMVWLRVVFPERREWERLRQEKRSREGPAKRSVPDWKGGFGLATLDGENVLA